MAADRMTKNVGLNQDLNQGLQGSKKSENFLSTGLPLSHLGIIYVVSKILWENWETATFPQLI